MALAGCLETISDPSPAGSLDLSARGPSGGRGGAASLAPGATEVLYFYDDAGGAHPIPKGVNPSGQGYTLNLQGVPVDVAAKSLLTDILGATYTLDPAATGTITMSTGGPVSLEQLLLVFGEALKANGLLLIKDGNGYVIRVGDSSAVTSSTSVEGYGLTALPLRHLGAQRMLTLLDGFAVPAGSVRAAPGDRLLLVRGTQSDRAAVAGIVASLDAELMSRPNAGIAMLKNAEASVVANELRQLADTDQGAAAGWKTEVLDRVNAILVQARDQRDLADAMQWIRRLDRAGSAGGSEIVVYRVQFARASQLAQVLQATFGDAGGSPPAAAPAAGGAASGGDAATSGSSMADGMALPAAPPDAGGTGGGGGNIRFTANDADNTIIMRAPNPTRTQALQLLANLDRAPAQVLIDVLLIEVTLNDAIRMGVQAYLTSNDTRLISTNSNSVGIGPSAPGFNLVFGTQVTPKVVIDALQQVTDVRVVSAPSVSAFENEEAEIKVVEQVPIVTQQVIGTQAADAPVVNSVEYRDAGVILRVTPQNLGHRAGQSESVARAVGGGAVLGRQHADADPAATLDRHPRCGVRPADRGAGRPDVEPDHRRPIGAADPHLPRTSRQGQGPIRTAGVHHAACGPRSARCRFGGSGTAPEDVDDERQEMNAAIGSLQGGDPLETARRRAEEAGLPLMRDHDWPARIELPPGLSLRYLRAVLMLPLGEGPGGSVRLAVADPRDRSGQEALRAALGRPLDLMVASQPAILSRIEAMTAAEPATPDDERLPEAEGADMDSALDAPVIALLDRLLAQATEARATDLHFEPGPGAMVIRQRVDGLLRQVTTVPSVTGRALVARLKILAGLNIAERRRAQDGPIRASIAGQSRDLRCATLPMVDGEGAALRILAGRQALPRLDGLGLSSGPEADLRRALAYSHGLILITGPTGSGKTTTLAAAIGELNDPRRKIISIEDPVEYHIPGVSQVQVNPAIGLTFSAGLRAFMRADPDVMLVGEVRDAETANITVQASLTGHLVLTTLHTNSAAGAVVRLAEMGVEPYLLAATLRLGLGQRLVRRLCRSCRRPVNEPLPFPAATLSAAGIAPDAPVPAFAPEGCEHCGGTGYYGRDAVFEVMPVTEALRRRILEGAGTAALHAAALAEGMQPMLATGLAQVLNGTTSAQEVLRVVQDD